MQIREATRDDVPAIVALMAADLLGARREQVSDPLPQGYFDGFEAIAGDPNNHLIVGEEDGCVVATLQLTFIPGLTYQGGWRAQVEAVRVSAARRGNGLGRTLMQWAIDEADRRGCHLVQLTTNKQRVEAHRFYTSLGFEATHEGMKRYLRGDVGGSVPVDG